MDDLTDLRPYPEHDALADLAALHLATSPEELWRALIVPGGRSSTDAWEAIWLFRGQHGQGAPGAMTTALLLATDGRWDRCTGKLIVGLADASILSEAELDAMAVLFVWADHYPFEYPVSWLGGEWLEVDVEPDPAPGPTRTTRRVQLDPATPVHAKRPIRPPLRRWAAARLLRAGLSKFDALRDRAHELDVRHGAAVVSGLLDAAGPSDGALARRAIRLGLSWPIGSVRALALDLLAATDPAAARARAAVDPDQKVRRWTPRVPRRMAGAADNARSDAAGSGERRKGRALRSHLVSQAELFPEDHPDD